LPAKSATPDGATGEMRPQDHPLVQEALSLFGELSTLQC